MEVSTSIANSIDHLDWLQPILMLASFGVLAAAEFFYPKRPRYSGDASRELNNIGLGAAGSLVMYWAWGWVTLGEAALAGTPGWEPLAQLPLSPWLVIVVGVVLIDALGYASHRLFHAGPWLWQLHKVHHSDPAFDGSTGFRHHPLEQLAGEAIEFVFLAALGIPLVALAINRILATVHNIFCHSNLRLPDRVDRGLRLVIVTPDMHRVHHSARFVEGNSNFGIMFPWWDRLFSTYRAAPIDGHQRTMLGLAEFGDDPQLGFTRLLLLPMRRWLPRI